MKNRSRLAVHDFACDPYVVSPGCTAHSYSAASASGGGGIVVAKVARAVAEEEQRRRQKRKKSLYAKAKVKRQKGRSVAVGAALSTDRSERKLPPSPAL